MSTFSISLIIAAISFVDLLFLTLVSNGKGIILVVLTQLISAIVGVFTIRKIGFNLIFYVDAELKKETKIIRELWDEFYILLGGCLLFLPGFLSDLAGTMLLIKDIRWVILDFLEH